MGKRGPKLTKIDWKQATNMAAINCTGEEMAAILDIDYDTLQRACKRDHGIKFADWIAKKSASGKMSLRRKQYTTAMDGNVTMLIWLGKNWLNQKDKQEEDKADEVEGLVKALSVLSSKLPV